jgi:arabinogalactan endo-1,4-beta-galactosidase
VQNTARNAGAIGVFHWEPTWYAIPGNGWNPTNINSSGNEWDNMAVFNWTGRINPNVRWTP